MADRTRAKVKTGKYVKDDDGLPENVQRTMAEPDPDWDWWSSGGWIVLRMHDGGKEFARVAAVIKKEVFK